MDDGTGIIGLGGCWMKRIARAPAATRNGGSLSGGCRIQLSRMVLAAFSASLSFSSAAYAMPVPDCIGPTAEIELPAGTLYPNGIAIAVDGTLFVGQVTSGRILRKHPDRTWEMMFAGSDEIYAATSLRIDEPRGLLWGASPDFLPGDQARPHRIFALNLDTGKVERSLPLPDEGFGNDLAIAANGTVYVTDSRLGRVLSFTLDTEDFVVEIEDDRLRSPDGIGVGGIALTPEGRLIVGNYGSGRLYVVDGPVGTRRELRELDLPRRLENPDGMAFTKEGSLIVLEGAVQSGAGKVLRVAEPFESGQRSLETLVTGLESPVNLALAPDGRAWITESRIRHRLLPGRQSDVPLDFRILSFNPGVPGPGSSECERPTR